MQHVTANPPPPPLDGGGALIAWADELRATSPVWYNETLQLWHVFSFELTSRVLTETDTFSSDLSAVMPTDLFMQGNFMRMDPPEHRRYRNLINKAFTPRSVQSLAGRIAELADELITALPVGEPVDFVAKLAFPLPLSVIAELLGVPTSDREMFATWAEDLFSGNIEKPFDPESIAKVEAAASPMHDYLLEHVKQARDSDAPGLIADVARIELDGERLTDEEAVTFAALALIAGHITTTSLLGSAMLCLDDNPDAHAALVDDPERIPAFIEEVLRLRPPFLALPRYTTTAVTLGDQHIPEHSVVVPSIYASNRDPEKFPEPHRFDMTRDDAGVTFGHGVHYCLGGPLARMEADIALRALLARTPKVSLVADRPPTFFGAQGLLGCRSLHAIFAKD